MINEASESDLQDLCQRVPSAHLVLDCFGVDYINSIGVVRWLQFLGDLRRRKLTYEYRRCSPTFVDYCIIVPSFTAGGVIRSVTIPFSCDACGAQGLVPVEMEGIAAFAAEPRLCAECGGPMEADGLLDDVLSVLVPRSPAP
jgi:hypothetical protein